jgi:hypothetical protein
MYNNSQSGTKNWASDLQNKMYNIPQSGNKNMASDLQNHNVLYPPVRENELGLRS